LRFTVEFRARGVGVKLLWDSKVYKPSAATRLIAENLPDPRGLKVLDLGTGSGVLAVLASKLGASEVVATDVSRRALRVAAENIKLNQVSNVELRFGDLYHPIHEDERFHLILCNPPMTPSPTPLPRFTWGGTDGRRVLDLAILGAPKYLEPGGRLLIPAVSLVGIGRTLRMLRRAGLSPRVLDYDTYPFGSTLLGLMKYLDRLPDADYFYDGLWRPCWRIVLFEGLRT